MAPALPARQQLIDLCGKANVSKKGNMPALKDRLVANFLTLATAEQLLKADQTEIWDVRATAASKDAKDPGL